MCLRILWLAERGTPRLNMGARQGHRHEFYGVKHSEGGEGGRGGRG